jgi:mono/diheme cytochrome c family protein
MRNERPVMRVRVLSIVVCLLLTSATVLVSRVEGQDEKPAPNPEARKLKNPVPSNAASITAGQALFQKYCRACHGATGNGDSPIKPKGMTPSDLTDSVWDRGSSDGEIFFVIQNGAGPKFQMKGLKGKITDQETWHLVNFVRSLGAASK